MSSIIILLLSTIKKHWLTILSFSLTGACMAQGPVLSGNVYDTSKQPVGFADVIIKRTLNDSTQVLTAFTDENGHFEIAKNLTQDKYNLTVKTIGFEEYSSEITITENTVLPDIILKETSTQIKDVVIEKKRPIVKRKIDRMEFDVENSILSSDNAWEILRKTPGVSTATGGLSIRGSNNILVTINDKKVYLTGAELQNLLENTDGDNIKSIEVITTPPSRYEAQGSAVLNIKMKKNILGGYKGSVVGAYVQSMYPKGVTATSHYYKDNRFSVNGNYMFGSGHYYGENNGTVTYFNPDNTVASQWKSDEKAHYRSTQQQSYSFNFEYTIDSLNVVSIGTTGFASLKSTANINTPTNIYDGFGQLDSLYTNQNKRDYPQKNNTINGLYEHKFNADSKLTVSSDITSHYFNQEQQLDADFLLPDGVVYRQTDMYSNDTRRINLISAQADYIGKAASSNIEAGIRYGKVDADNDFEYDAITTGSSANELYLANEFLYDEHIFAGYVSADREIGKWGFKAGLRGEQTKLKGNSVTTGEVNRQDYFKLFPTVYIMYNATDNDQIGISYGKRIARPQYGSLNPFRVYNTPYAYSTGDPQLLPAIGHTINLQYTLNKKYNFDLYYRYDKDPYMEISYQDYDTNTIVTQYTNIDHNSASGLDFNTNLEIMPWWQTGLQATVMYKEDTFQGIDGGMYTNEKVSFNGSTNNRFTLNKMKDLTGELSFFYSSPQVQGTYTYGAMSSMSVSFRKMFFKGNGELALIFSDIYRGERQTVTMDYANQNTQYKTYNDSQSFRIQVRYRFGNQNLRERSRGTTDEQQRL